jgi:hypothetical protein
VTVDNRPDMTTHRCYRCGKYWHSAAINPGLFLVITKFCPLCIPLITHRLTDDSPTIRPITLRTAG